MSSVRIITAAAALMVTGLAATPAQAQACSYNIFFPCPQPAPMQPRPSVTRDEPVVWGMQPTAPTERVVVKASPRRVAKKRVRYHRPAKAVAAIAKPAVEAPLPASRSVAVSAAPKPAEKLALDKVEPARLEPAKEVEPAKEFVPAARLVAVVDAHEVNEIDLAAGPARSVVPVASAGLAVAESKDSETAPSAVASIAQVLAMLGGALAAASIFRVVST